MSTKKELDVLSSFIFCIYEKYVEGVNKYISEIKKYPKKNRLQFISNFINDITLKIIDRFVE